MTKYYSLFGKTTTDTEVQVVKENQIIIYYGAIMTEYRYVVYKVEHSEWGYKYHLINTVSKEITQTDIIKPLSQKFGIGLYYDDVKPEFMDVFEVAILAQEAQKEADAEAEKAEKERQEAEKVKEVGRKRLAELIPIDAQAVIVAQLQQDDSDSMTDYYAYSTSRRVILGFSNHTRDIFSEMRKYAGNFSETACLTEKNEEYEHREKYSMGAGYYLGASKFYGWIIKKDRIYNLDRFIEDFAYTAGCEDNIHIKIAENSENTNTCSIVPDNFNIVNYSDKAIAVFGDTKPIKDELSALGGRYNGHLTFNGEKRPGWIFQKSKEQQVRDLIKTN